MPAVPSGSNRALGLVMSSTRSTALAGRDSKKASRAPPDKPEGRPSMRIWTPADPRSVMLPSMSTLTEGMFSSSSVVFPPRLVRSLPTWNTRRSTFISMTDACSTTTASSRAVMSASNDTVPAFQERDSGLRGENMCGALRKVVYPGNRTSRMWRPTSISRMSNVPSSPERVPSTTLLSLRLITTTEAKGRASWLSASSTWPWTRPILGLGPPSPGRPCPPWGRPVWAWVIRQEVHVSRVNKAQRRNGVKGTDMKCIRVVTSGDANCSKTGAGLR